MPARKRKRDPLQEWAALPAKVRREAIEYLVMTATDNAAEAALHEPDFARDQIDLVRSCRAAARVLRAVARGGGR